MLLFIIIFFAMVITVGLSAVLGFSFYLKRRRKRLETENPVYLNPPAYRSLFDPTDEEIRADERQEFESRRAKEVEEARQKTDENLTALMNFINLWRENPHRGNTVELFRRAAETESAKAFSETAETVIEVWREKRIENLSALDLADLLDSHLRTLPQQERTAGKLFWLREETARLSRESEDNF